MIDWMKKKIYSDGDRVKYLQTVQYIMGQKETANQDKYQDLLKRNWYNHHAAALELIFGRIVGETLLNYEYGDKLPEVVYFAARLYKEGRAGPGTEHRDALEMKELMRNAGEWLEIKDLMRNAGEW